MKFELVSTEHKKDNMGYSYAKLPARADSGSAGYDFYSPANFVIKPHEKVFLWSNVKCKLAQDEVLMIYPRSSLAMKKGLVLGTVTGVIDASYYNNEDNEGNIGLPLYNMSDEEIVIRLGDRIAQGVAIKYIVAEDDATKGKRKGGFGSSGV